MPFARSPIITVQDEDGNVLIPTSVLVTSEAGGSPIIYGDRDGTVTLGNPWSPAETDGSFPFHVTGGRYRLDVTHPSGVKTLRNIPIGLLQEQDAIALSGRRIAARVATTANITIATALNNGDTIDGVVLATGDVVLVWKQTAPAQNGVYVVAASPARHTDFDAYDDHVGAVVTVAEGSTHAEKQFWSSANNGGTLGTTAIDFTRIGPVAAAGTDGADPGYLLTWDTGTADADPGSGVFRANNASLASATFLYISKTNRAGSSIAARLAEIDDSTNATKAKLVITNPATDVQASFVAGTVTDATDYVKVAVSGHAGATSFTDETPLSLQIYPDGNAGADGADGSDPGILLTWDDDTADADQGAGTIWANNASLASATVLYLSKTSRGGSDIAAFLATLDDSTNATKGYAVLTRASDEAQAIFRVTGLTDATGYVKLAVTGHAGMTNPAAADAISFQFLRTGDAGDVTATAPYTAAQQIVVAAGAGKDTKDTPAQVSDAGVITGTTEDAGTDTVVATLVAKRTSSGTPAVGIGSAIAFDVETAAGNVERGMTIEAEATNVGAGTEAFDFVAKAMIGGAAVAELFRVTSAGVMTFLATATKQVLTAIGGVNLTGGFTATSYGGHGGAPPVVSSGTVTPAPGASQSNIQHYTNGGAHTLAPPANPCTVYIEITNNASAGAITASGFDVKDGDSFNTTNGKIFGCSIVKGNAKSRLTVKALN